MTTTNIIRIAFTSFFAYAVMASIMSPLGIISQPIADLFSVSVTDANSQFTYITTGILVGAFIAMFIFDWLQVKTIIILNSLAVAVAIVLLYVINGYAWLPFSFAIIGISCGINLTAAAVVITRAFSEGRRASMLLLTDCFYSIGAICSSYVAAHLMAEQYHWSSAYAIALLLVASIVIIALISVYPQEPQHQPDGQADLDNSGKWPVSVYFCASALFIYMLGMVSLYSWMPNYAQSVLNMPQEKAGQLVSHMFSGMFVSQIIMFFLVLKFPMGRLILLTSGFAALLNFSLWNISDVSVLPTAIFVMGVFAGGLLKTFITYGTLSMDNAPSRLVSFLMLSTALGTAVAPSISSMVVSQTSLIGGLMLSSACYLATFVLATISVVLQTNNKR